MVVAKPQTERRSNRMAMRPLPVLRFRASRPLLRPLLTLVMNLTLAQAIPVAAQSPLTKPTPAQTAPTGTAARPKASDAHKRPVAHGHKKTKAKPSPEVVAGVKPAVPAAPPAPPKPDWPANEKPSPATIRWDASGLRIEAANSSLSEILQEIATLTGATVQGMGADQRVYGSYGPGTARDVLARLLDGSGYNLLLIGDQGSGTPRQIVLTSPNGAKSTLPARPATSNDDDDVAQDDQPQQDQQPTAPPQTQFRPGQPPQGGQGPQQSQPPQMNAPQQ